MSFIPLTACRTQDYADNHSEGLSDLVHEHFKELSELLIRRNITITLMESCTSGQVASLITDTAGSSAVFPGSDVTYSNEAKIAAGVDASVIKQFGVYSSETAIAMASACRDSFHADIGIGVTGSLGTVDPANSDSIPGEVHYAISIKGEIYDYFMEVDSALSRFEEKLSIADSICLNLLKILN
ncbi:MAG: CinA family protein [Erysipelotrichia bacterium]|nr:CinA family protein [Erysipelotrichia bacterium]